MKNIFDDGADSATLETPKEPETTTPEGTTDQPAA